MAPLLGLFKSKLYTAFFLLLLVLSFGVVGYRLITEYSWVDSFYMTVITITTVGFGEVQPLSDSAKIFTILLILSSVIIVGYALSVITEYILSRNSVEDIKQKEMQKKIDSLKDHIIVCGYGRNGIQVVKKLLAYEKPFVIIEKDKDVIEKFQSEELLFIHGNANEDDVLMEAGVDKAETLICALPQDADSLFVVLSARQINEYLTIISRASHETSYKKLKLAGADNVILPDRIGGDHMASLVVVPDLIEFIDNLSIVGESNIIVEEVASERLYNTDNVKSIKDLDLRNETGCTVIGFKNAKDEYIVNPEADQELMPNSKIIVLGRPEQIKKLNSIYKIK